MHAYKTDAISLKMPEKLTNKIVVNKRQKQYKFIGFLPFVIEVVGVANLYIGLMIENIIVIFKFATKTTMFI